VAKPNRGNSKTRTALEILVLIWSLAPWAYSRTLSLLSVG
jgi:hypothetical protein